MGLINDILFTNQVGKLSKKALDVSAQRALLINSNIANAETPGYKAVDLKPFESELKQAYKSQAAMVKTDPRHMSGGVNNLNNYQPTIEISQDTPRLDGNNVNLDKEMTKMMENSLNYQTIIAARKKRGQIIDAAIEMSK